MAEKTQNDILQTEISVEVNGDTFVFAIPTVHDEIKRGARMRALLQQIVGPGEDAALYGLDGGTSFFLDVCATFETLLRKASVNWVFSSVDGQPKVDSAKFPPDKVDQVTEAFVSFREQLTKFRGTGTADKAPPGTETVAG